MKKVIIEVVKSRAKKLYTPASTNYKLQYHVRVVSPNGKILMSSETYNSPSGAMNCAHIIQSLAESEIRVIDLTLTNGKKK